ncbi:MAG: helix-turn-helix domain-containing protein, partial [Chloroflexi bacterium]|nr:helix-turn-helix domain-containing protein [Chloroflexota bacterium]
SAQNSERRLDPAVIVTFGELLKYLRRRARLTQDELGRAVGYSREQINRLERNQRLPDVLTLASLFVPALDLREEPELVARFMELAAAAHGETLPEQVQISHTLERRITLKPQRDGRALNARADKGRLSESQRDAHRAAAEWAELAQGDVVEAARRYGLAGEFQHAADALSDQGILLFNQGKAEPAAAVIDELLSALQTRGLAQKFPDVMRVLLTTRGDLLINTARADQAEANYRQALALANGAVRGTLVNRWSSALIQRGRAAEALALVQETLLQLAPSHRVLRAQLQVVAGGALLTLARYEESAQACTQALTLADEFALAMPLLAAGIRARAHNSLGAINAIRGERAAALAHWQNAVATAQLAGFRQLEFRAQGNIANLQYEQGALDAAEKACDAALAGLKSINDLQAAVKFIHLRANLHFVRGEIAESLALAQEACALKQQLGDRNSYLASLHQQVKALIVLGRWAEARASSAEGLQELERLKDQRTRGYWLTTLSEIEMLEDNPPRALEILRAVLELPGAAEDAKLSSDCANHFALATLTAGDAPAAAQWLTPRETTTWETELECELITCLAHWAQADVNQALRRAQNAATRARETGYWLFQKRAEKIQLALTQAISLHAPAQFIYGVLDQHYSE